MRLGIVILAAALAQLGRWSDPALHAALLSLAGVMVLWWVVDLIWDALVKGNQGTPPDIATTWGPLVALIVTMAGVVLGLLQAFDNKGHLSEALKVGTLSLALTVILGMMLFGLVVASPPSSTAAREFRTLIFNLTLWSLALGVLSIGWALFFR